MTVSVSLLLIVGLWGALMSVLAQPNASDYPVGDPRRCSLMNPNSRPDNPDNNVTSPQTSPLSFEVLPGFGWDNLRNVDMGQVVLFNYSQCQTTSDGSFLLPDFISVVPVKASVVQTSAKIFSHWANYTSSTSSSINFDMGLGFESVSISGSFSLEHDTVRSNQMNDNSYTAQTVLRYPRYEAMLQPFAPLHPTFKMLLLDIGAAYQMNEKTIARYLCEILVRDYGTHVSTKVEAGALLEQVEYIYKNYAVDQSNTHAVISAAAGASFRETFNLSLNTSVSTSSSDYEKYISSVTSSTVNTRGGPAFIPGNFSLTDWASAIDSNLVAIDRMGDPLYYFVTATNLPELPASTLNELQQGVKKAIEDYYSHNTIPGCTDRNSENYSPQANIDDGSCKPPVPLFNFGGIYKTCTMTKSDNGDLCDGQKTVNIMTQDYNCPDGFHDVLLNKGVTKTSHTDHICKSYFIFWKKCHDVSYESQADTSTYWCVSTQPQATGVLFGGLYTSQIDNPVTNRKGCPSMFAPAHVGIELDLQVCVSIYNSTKTQLYIPFAGFYSCKANNPLDGNAYDCPDGYSIYRAVVDQGCDINYCMLTKSLPTFQRTLIKRPPFQPLPPVPASPKDNLVIFDPETRTWRRDHVAMMGVLTGKLPEIMGLSVDKDKMAEHIRNLDLLSLNLKNAWKNFFDKSSDPDSSDFSCYNRYDHHY